MALSDSDRPQNSTPGVDATARLLDAARRGEQGARERLFDRCLPPLRRWAHGRLPPALRDVHNTGDLVQDTVLAAFGHLDRFEARHQGALQAYLRQAVMNRIRDLVRAAQRRPGDVAANPADTQWSPLDLAIGAENVERYEQGLARLDDADREAIIGRLELQLTYDELAESLAKPSAEAARLAVTGAMRHLAEEMRHG